MSASKAAPETVLVDYYAKPGRDAELQQVLARAWGIYVSEHMGTCNGHTSLILRERGQSQISFRQRFSPGRSAIPRPSTRPIP